jgi:hypothetical protein
MRSTLVTLLALVLSACATAGQEDGADRMTVVVVNEYPSMLTASAIWPASRVRLGEVAPNQTRTFSVPRRGNRLALGFEVFALPSPGTVAGPSVMQGGTTPSMGSPLFRTEALLVSPTEGIEWRVGSSGTLTFRTLPD